MTPARTSRRRNLACACLGLALSGLAGVAPAQAQQGDDFGVNSSMWQAGGFAFVSPKFEGSNSYKVVGVPFVAPAGFGQGNGTIQVKGADDVRLRVLQFSGFEFGPLAGYRFGRDSGDSTKLAGFADVEGGVVLGAFGGYRMGSLFLSASYHHQVTGDTTGGIVRLLAEQTLLSDRGTKLVAHLGTNIATEEYMSTYFGVSPAQAGLLPAFNTSAGFKDVNVGLKATIALSPRWTMYASATYARLVGDAASSPIIDTPDQFSGGVGLSYKFDFGR